MNQIGKLFTTGIVLLLVTALAAISAIASPLTQDENTDSEAPTTREDVLIQFADAANGEALFNTFQDEAGFACSTCHHATSEEKLIGPGLLNVGERAAIRAADQNAVQYILTSITNPDATIVDGFTDDLMPENWAEIYSQVELYDLAAYLLTLEGEAIPVATTNTTSTVAVSFTELPATADATRGEELFTTFQPDAGFACSTCHWGDKEDRLIGPGQLNIGTRAATRVADQNAVQYIYTSITNPDAYIVDGFTDDLMPENWADIYTDDDIFDIMAYLLTLEG
jgi:cytochrome c2